MGVKRQQWEYNIVHRVRGSSGRLLHSEMGPWDPKTIDLAPMGDEGWELVAVTTRSDFMGQTFAGTTTTEVWIFKRPKLGKSS